MNESTDTEATEAPAPATPLLRVITPNTTPEEVAAIVAVLSAMGGSAPAPAAPVREWASPARAARSTAVRGFPHGRGAWRASGLPR
ncbi:acyl-CoA carboxylase subunit epsilon [Nocardioides caeni]|uniref:Acyl-CoA carboxylase subunit epsilon n=1 Tax=Nocardioides caeni TaxID=574700 RepID=A0A4S8NQZ9_9ACTN|nr:acyl-CoA carboxylase subunit epsilon [Nocardioides caeni]THV17894.1 acyl-CoA carboxylase subunit epsilon [Nocardioides caeni]